MSEVHKNHILIIDDSYDSRILLKTLLEAKGYTTDCTPDGAEALALLNITQKLPQMILVDLRMPVMDGLAFRKIQRIEPRIKHIPILIMSGENNIHVIQEETNTKVLRKPLNIPYLLQTIDEML